MSSFWKDYPKITLDISGNTMYSSIIFVRDNRYKREWAFASWVTESNSIAL